ncbi:hypothetical protein [Neisseria shayeganii]|uniref:Uncharacterized protein n=1 Tax=Neisseria shayeganii TaxID=607712 RepID=A0A7D7NBK9_9NEIS|nr:hypothetical protein [Neisseria shayeganii]QMT41499.1 hypothetical protein H3L94_05615 [Neisseria shayeganii]
MSVLKRPEEVIMAVICALWVVLTYFCARYFGAPWERVLLISALTLIVLVPAFLLWQRNRITWLWPLFLGLLVACWWPFLDWLAIKDIPLSSLHGDTIILQRPWYASWPFKAALALLPVIGGYAWIWQGRRKALPVS